MPLRSRNCGVRDERMGAKNICGRLSGDLPVEQPLRGLSRLRSASPRGYSLSANIRCTCA
eukprot:454264-Pyramimonas_sp.AAC.1